MTCTVTTQYRIQCLLVCEADMLLQGMVGGWAVIEASHTVSSGLNVTCHMLISSYKLCGFVYICLYK